MPAPPSETPPRDPPRPRAARTTPRARRLLIGAALLATAGGAALALGLWRGRDASLAQVRDRGTIRIGYAIEAPFAFLSSGGEVTGESPEVARLVVRQLGGLRIEWRQSEFDALIDELRSGQIDVIAAGLFVTPERRRRVAFSLPTFQVAQGLLVQRGNPKRLHSYQEALGQRGVRLAVLGGSVEEQLLRRLGAREDELTIVPDARAGRVAVESGVADGLALSAPTVRWLAERQPRGALEAAAPFEQPPSAVVGPLGVGAFALRREDGELLRVWNGALEQVLGSEAHRAVLSRFGFDPRELPARPAPTR